MDTYIKIPHKFDFKQTNVSVTYPRPMAIYSHYDDDGRVFSRYTDNSVSVRRKNTKGIYEVVKKWYNISDNVFSSIIKHLDVYHNLDSCIEMLEK